MIPGLVATGLGAAAAAGGVMAYGSLAPNSGLYGRVIGRGPRSLRHLYLTFDDGPCPRGTEGILEALDVNRAPAAFFQLGERVERFAALAQAVSQAGHEIGNHTYAHQKLHLKGSRFIAHDLKKAHEAIVATTGRLPRSFRAPHGYRNPFVQAVARELDYEIFGWTIGVWDSDRPGAEEIRRRVRARLSPGAIILLHDGDAYDLTGDRSQTAAALPGIIGDARDLGYTFRPLRDLLHRSGGESSIG